MTLSSNSSESASPGSPSMPIGRSVDGSNEASTAAHFRYAHSFSSVGSCLPRRRRLRNESIHFSVDPFPQRFQSRLLCSRKVFHDAARDLVDLRVGQAELLIVIELDEDLADVELSDVRRGAERFIVGAAAHGVRQLFGIIEQN